MQHQTVIICKRTHKFWCARLVPYTEFMFALSNMYTCVPAFFSDFTNHNDIRILLSFRHFLARWDYAMKIAKWNWSMLGLQGVCLSWLGKKPLGPIILRYKCKCDFRTVKPANLKELFQHFLFKKWAKKQHQLFLNKCIFVEFQKHI